jgi:SAM-dependent methyltransferase
MVDAARSRLATNEGTAEIDVVTCRWDQLSEHFTPASFDMVLCIGSAIAHTSDAAAMVSALRAFRSMLRPGGVVVIDSHDWEVVIAAGGPSTVDPVVVERDGTRCIRTFTWHLSERPGAPAIFEPAVIFHDGERAEMRSHPIRLWPFTRRELRDRLIRAGFEEVQLDRMPGDDRYTAVARRRTQSGR